MGLEGQGHLKGPPVPLHRGAGDVGEDQVHVTQALLALLPGVHDLGVGQVELFGEEPAVLPPAQQLEGRLPFEDQLGADDPGLCASALGLGPQHFHGVWPAGGKGKGVLIGKGLLLDIHRLQGAQLAGFLADSPLLWVCCLGGQAAVLGLKRLQVQAVPHPYQHLSGVEQVNVHRQHPGHHVDGSPPGEPGQVRGCGEGQGDLHGLHPLAALGLIEDGGFQQARQLPPALLSFVSLEEQAGLAIQHLPNVRPGIGHDGLRGLLLFQCGAADRLPAPHGLLPEFQFHHGNQSFLVSGKYLSHPMSRDWPVCLKYGKVFAAGPPAPWGHGSPPFSFRSPPFRA